MKEFSAYTRYAFVFAHPDDEIFTAAIIQDLVKAGKDVYTIYLTNGDYVSKEMGQQREAEASLSMSLLFVPPENFSMVGFSEHELFTRADEVVKEVINTVATLKIDCVVGHDYEGGHNGHDLASFCAYKGAQAAAADFWVFPAYNYPPSVRRWNQFIANKTIDYMRPLTTADQELKQAVIHAHASQESYFNTILSSNDAQDFLAREILHFAGKSIDFQSKPTEPIGYETPGKTDRFDSLQAVIVRHL